MKTKWYVYIVSCKDKSLYTGITTDIIQRLRKHTLKKGAKYLYGKLPIKLVYSEEFRNKVDALKRESEIKSWKRKEKLNLIKLNK